MGIRVIQGTEKRELLEQASGEQARVSQALREQAEAERRERRTRVVARWSVVIYLAAFWSLAGFAAGFAASWIFP